MEDDVDAPPQSTWWQLEDTPSASSNKTSSIPKIPIKIPIIHRLRNRSKRKERSIPVPEYIAPISASAKQNDVAPVIPSSPKLQRFRNSSKRRNRSISIPEDIVGVSGTAPLTPSRKNESEKSLHTPPEIRRQRIFDAIDRATSIEKDVISSFSTQKSDRKKSPSLSPGSFKRDQSAGWNSYSTLRTAELSSSTASVPYSSPHTIGSTSRRNSRKKTAQSPLTQSKSSLDSTPEFSELSPEHDSKRSIHISELGPSSKRSLTISELSNSFSTRPPRSSNYLRTSGSSSSHVRTSGGSSSQILPASMTAYRQSYSAHSRSVAVDPSDRSSNGSSSMRSSARSVLRSSRTEKSKKTEKQLSLAQSSSIASLENYGKLSQRRSSATQESMARATKMLHEVLEVEELSSLLKTKKTGSNLQHSTSNSNRSLRSVSIRSGRSMSRRSISRRSGSPSHRQRSLQEIVTHSFMSTDSSSVDGISSLEDSPSVEATLRRNIAKGNEGLLLPRSQRRQSQKKKNDMMDISLMARRGSRDMSISLHTGDSSVRNSKSQDSLNRFHSTHESTVSPVARESRRSTRTSSGNSKRSMRTSDNSNRNSRSIEMRKKSLQRRKSAAAALGDIPRTIEFVTMVPIIPPSPPAEAKSRSSRTSSSKSSPASSKSSSKLSPVSSTASNKLPSRKQSPKVASAGARHMFKSKRRKKGKRNSKKDQDQSSASHASESLPSLFGTALCLDHSSHHNPTTSPFLQYDVGLNDATPQTAVRQRSVGSMNSLLRNSFGSLGSNGFVLTEEEEGGGGVTSPSVSLESDFLSAASPPTGLFLPRKKEKKKPRSIKKKRKKKRPMMATTK
ncbi:unnamed protein product [Cylindrotheca closterium]|uniref:Uncharacterized protein n=1 Tax=Cylindrotheca closterium TaxID=2856 RepID=A0AAD2G2A7_9STRA|nr:unnamed protein product [Cylindrotheca closterium]